MAASASFSFEDGMRTVSCITTLAFRMRVSMSANGSVIVIDVLLSPARLGHARQLAGVGHAPQADAAQPELAVHRPRPAAPAAPRVGAHLELGLALLLLDECLLRHECSCASYRRFPPLPPRTGPRFLRGLAV